jgi:YD repeat-containing protein
LISDAAIHAYFADPFATSEALLQKATRRMVIDLGAYSRSGSEPQPKPTVVGVLARQTHAVEMPAGETIAIQHSFSYRDGCGREIQKKDQAPPGPLQPGGAVVARRWVGSGWTIFNNKGSAVRQYQPFFDNTHDFRFGVEEGVGSTTFFDPLGRTVGVLHPNHVWEKVHATPWRHESWDVNDTVLVVDPAADPDVGDHFRRLPSGTYLPTWHAARASGALGAAEQDAADKTAVHASTPVVTFLDPLGRVFLTVAHNRRREGEAPNGETPADERLRTRIVYDIEGNQRGIVDAVGRTMARYDYDLVGNRVHSTSMDAGERWLLADVGGRPVRGWDARGHMFVTTYDAAGRLTSRTVRGSDPARSDPRTLDRDVLFELTQYGEDQPDDVARNLRTHVFRSFHGTGVRTTERYDNQSNAEVVVNWFTEDHKTLPDWSHAPPLQADAYVCRYRFDALNRITTLTAPDRSIAHITYDDSSRMAAIDVNLRAAAVTTPFVRSVDYSAQGQRTRIVYGNDVTTSLEYGPLTFRLTRVTTTRPPRPALPETRLFTDAAMVQDLRFAYDPIGNVTTVVDEALATVVSGNDVVRPAWPYRYDAMYRLIEAAGREHAAQGGWNTSPADGDHRDYPFAGAAQLSDLQALRRYVERYRYDAAGNIVEMAHQAAGGGWSRSYSYEEASLLEPERAGNRLSATSVGNPELYTYDEHGSMTRMPHLPLMQWNFKNELIAASRQVAATPEITYFGYGGDGRRTRKVTERQNGTRRSERLYLDGWEIYREYGGDGTTVMLARDSLHVFDGKRRIAVVDTQTVADGSSVGAPVPATRYQFGNHLGSVCVELDHAAALISYEEYTPYGSPALQAGASAAEVRRRRYRYLALERDSETGFGHHGARYYVPWLGRGAVAIRQAWSRDKTLCMSSRANSLTRRAAIIHSTHASPAGRLAIRSFRGTTVARATVRRPAAPSNGHRTGTCTAMPTTTRRR